MEAIDLITNRKINLNKRGVHRVAIKYDGDELVYGYTRHSRYFRTMIFFQKEKVPHLKVQRFMVNVK